jgi:hypothetical protein
MKRLLPACLLACALSGAAKAATIWQENFSGYTNAGVTGQGSTNYPAAITNWSINVSGCATLTPGSGSAADCFMAVSTSGGRMEAVNVDGEAVWSSAVVNISGYTNVSLSVAASETGSSTSTSKYVKLFYRLNGGAETAFSSNAVHVGNWGSATAVQSNLCGSTVQIVARVNNPNAVDKSIFDAVTISGDITAANLPPVLDPIGNWNVLEMGTLSFTATASDLINNDPVILSATHLPTGAVFTNGVFTWSNAVPVGAYAVTFYATDKDGSDSETVTITVAPRPLLFISEIADPDGTGGDAYRFVELYNAGTNAINLASNHWHLSRQNNGADWSDIPLTGTVSAAGTYVIAKDRSDFNDAYGFYPQQESSGVDGNGNDAYFLYYGGNHTSGTLIDIYGQTDTTGTGAVWEYTDSRAARNNSVLQPNDIWRASEWTITSRATVSDMTPGLHGPVPEFQGLENPFVFLGDSLRLTVTAVNTVRTDVIRLSAAARPAGTTFAVATGTNIVSSTLNWNSPTAGVYTATFAAAGLAGTNTASITITVSSGSQIDGKFYGWSGDTIFKLVNGQFWQQSVSGSKTVSPALYRPHITITNYLSYQRRMYVTSVTGYAAVMPLAVTESTVTNTFTGLHYQNSYRLADGTIWKQISSEIISSNAASVAAWRWTKDGQQKIRFLDRNDIVIGTCTVETSAPPGDTTVYSEIDGYFRGWQNKRVFALKNGQFWQQTSLDGSSQTLYRPAAVITNWLQTGNWRMSVAGLAGYVSVQQLTNVIRTAVEGNFYGFGNRHIFHLADGTWWKQTSSESSTSTRFGPEVLVWSESKTDYLEMPDEGLRVSVEELNVQLESTITNSFTGLHYGNAYRLADGGDWLQLSFENISTNVTSPNVMLWIEETQPNILVRDGRDATIGTCIVGDSASDADSDGQSNAAEVLAGFDPLDSQSQFELRQTDRYVLSWDAVEGRVYTIEWSPSLTERFRTLETSILWPQSSWTDTVHAVETRGFYRIGVRLAE